MEARSAAGVTRAEVRVRSKSPLGWGKEVLGEQPGRQERGPEARDLETTLKARKSEDRGNGQGQCDPGG